MKRQKAFQLSEVILIGILFSFTINESRTAHQSEKDSAQKDSKIIEQVKTYYETVDNDGV